MEIKNVSEFYSHLAGSAALAVGMLFVNSPLIHALTVPEERMPVMETQQAGTVKGQVVDLKGEAVIGASISVKGAKAGSVTDLNGNFTLKVDPNATLVVSYVGFQKQEVPLNGRSDVTITLQENATSLDEVVVVGYGTQKKASLTSAISQIKGDEVFQDRPITNATVALQGAVPGLVITRSSSRPGNEGAAMKIRGDISVNGSSSPLVLIDGMTSSLDELNEMDPNDIENISVLKDASAAIYGARSANGVVLVTTKRGKKGKAQISYSGTFSTTIDGIQPKLTNNRQWLDMFYEAQYRDNSVIYPDLVGKTNAEGYSMLEDQSNFWWILGGSNILTGTDANGTVWNNRKMWEALRNGMALTLNNSGTVSRYEPWHYLMDELYGKAFSQKHSVSISGADEKFGYRVSLSYADNNSQLKVAEDGEKKYTGLLNVDYQATKIMKVEAGVAYERRIITGPSTDVGAGFKDPWFWPFYNQAGQFYDTFGGNNPVGGLVGGGQIHRRYTTFRANGKVSFDLKALTEGLSVYASGAYKNARTGTSTQKKFIQYYDWDGNPTKNRQAPGSFAEDDDTYENMNGGIFANYQRTFANAHNVSAMIGMTAEVETFKGISASRNKGPIYSGSDLQDLNVYVSGTDNGAGGGQSEWAFLSYVTRLGYTYKDKYLFEFLGRRDGSSKLVPEQRWKNFYSFSGGWVISQEEFMKNLTWLNFLKVRYNYGKTGSVEGIGNYESYATVNLGTAWFGTGDLSSQTTAGMGMVSRDRSWETINSYDIGFDVTVLNNRLSATFDWFQRTNEGMFIPISYPSVLGASAPKTNNGRFRAKGWEFSVNWKDRIGEVSYSLGAQISDAKTDVMKLQNNENVPNPGKNTARLVGKPKTAIYVYETGGLFQTQAEVDDYYNKYYWNADHTGPKPENIIPAPKEKDPNSLRPGARKVVDVNGDGAITKADLVYKGDADPHFVFGFKAGLEWKGIDFSAFFQGTGKQNVLRGGYLYAPFIANYTMQNYTFLGKTWTPENPDAKYAVMSRYSNFNKWNYENKDVSLQNSRYVRLKSLVLGYTLPKAWTEKVSLSKVRVYFSGEDLWEWTSINDGFDPEHGEASNSTFPFSRLISFGIDVTF